jgi:putative SOS response-associated peptidase YedK
MRWGLVPPWAEDLAIGSRMINARGETVDQKPSFRKAFASRRCLIPADGYFEWQKTSDGKQPYLIELAAAGVFAMAGLWEENRKAIGDGTTLLSCTVITTEANRTTGQVHDRMPVILDPDQYDRWLDPGFRDTETLKGMLDSAPENLLSLTPVSRHVNNPKNDDTQCVSPPAN